MAEIKDVRMCAEPGETVGEALREALRLAVTEWRNVQLEIGEECYRVCANDMFMACQRIETNSDTSKGEERPVREIQSCPDCRNVKAERDENAHLETPSFLEDIMMYLECSKCKRRYRGHVQIIKMEPLT